MSSVKEICFKNCNVGMLKTIKPEDGIQIAMDELHEIHLVDGNDQSFVFRRIQPEPDPLNNSITCETLSAIKEMFATLTDEQRKISMHIYYSYKNKIKIYNTNESGEISEDNPKIIIQGPAGSGKTTIINFIGKLLKWQKDEAFNFSQYAGPISDHQFLIPASTHKALKDCTFFVCDDISMVDKRKMSKVNTLLQQTFNNQKPYGDRFVLLVGDLYQIDAMSDVEEVLSKTPTPKYWECCEFYELTNILRQKDPNFIRALNNFRKELTSKEDRKLLRSRQNINVPDIAIHLFRQIKDANEYNTQKLNSSYLREETVEAIEDFGERPTKLRVKIGIRYMITSHIDVSDGLTNGTIGSVRGFQCDNGNVDVIWMEFYSDKTGRKARRNYLKPQYNNPVPEHWVPIQRVEIAENMSDIENPTKCKVFPLRVAEAITIFKSQGHTYYNGVCIHLKDKKLRRNINLLYTALTRVERLDDLYIDGAIDFYALNFSTDQRQKELRRLRKTRKLKLAYETFEDKPDDVIVYLNTKSTFNDHYKFITTDSWYENASLLIFTETIASGQIAIPNFEIAFPLNEEAKWKSGGKTVCYKKANKSLLKLADCKVSNTRKGYVTVFLYENFLYIVSVVKGDWNDDEIKQSLEDICCYLQDKKCVFFLGNTEMSPSLAEWISSSSFKQMLSCDATTNTGSKQTDVVYTRNMEIQQDCVGFYEYIPASHKPIYVKLPPKSESIPEAMETDIFK